MTAKQSESVVSNSSSRPNVVVVMADDMGYSDLGCFGSRIQTPHLDGLAADGVVMSQFYNTARCSPARASLLTGLHPHQAGIGVLTGDDGPKGYPGTLNDRCMTMAEVLGGSGYGTYLSGKWHLCGQTDRPSAAWPRGRGFDHSYGILGAAGSYFHPGIWHDDQPVGEPDEDFYLTTRVGEQAADWVDGHLSERSDPFFCYLAFTAPHWPLQAPADAIARCAERFSDGWDAQRAERLRSMIDSGILPPGTGLTDRDDGVPAWSETADQDWQALRMAVYAAQIEMMDAEVGRMLAVLRSRDALEDTLIIFLSDNGGCAEEMPPGWMDDLAPGFAGLHQTPDGRRLKRGNAPWIPPGPDDTYSSYGRPWANVSNTPFREYKHWVHEGGIATPLIAHWPAGLNRPGRIDHSPAQLPDIMATLLDVTGASYPETFGGRDILPPEGTSMLDHWNGGPDPERKLYFEHEGNCAIRQGRWKLVRKHPAEPGQAHAGYDPWELYDMDTDRIETCDLASENPELVAALSSEWQNWADRCGIKPREDVMAVSPPNVDLTNHHYRSASEVPQCDQSKTDDVTIKEA